jgi:hypothetical protein
MLPTRRRRPGGSPSAASERDRGSDPSQPEQPLQPAGSPPHTILLTVPVDDDPVHALAALCRQMLPLVKEAVHDWSEEQRSMFRQEELGAEALGELIENLKLVQDKIGREKHLYGHSETRNATGSSVTMHCSGCMTRGWLIEAAVYDGPSKKNHLLDLVLQGALRWVAPVSLAGGQDWDSMAEQGARVKVAGIPRRCRMGRALVYWPPEVSSTRVSTSASSWRMVAGRSWRSS